MPTSPAAHAESSPRRRSKNSTNSMIAAEQPPSTTAGEAGAISEATADAIARRAYELYCERGCEHGRDMEDWLQAEQEVRSATVR